jgi:hypothetical protein
MLGKQTLSDRTRHPRKAYLVFEDFRISHNGRMVGSHAIVIHQHLLLMVQLSVRTKIVGEIRRLGLGVSVEGGNLPRLGGVHKRIVGWHSQGKQNKEGWQPKHLLFNECHELWCMQQFPST